MQSWPPITGKVDFIAETQSTRLYTAPENFLGPLAGPIAIARGEGCPDYFREIAAVVQAAAGGPPNAAAIVEVMRRHGLTPAS